MLFLFTITFSITRKALMQTCYYHQLLLKQLETAYYKRSFNSLAKSSNPGLPSKANMFFLYVAAISLILLKIKLRYINICWLYPSFTNCTKKPSTITSTITTKYLLSHFTKTNIYSYNDVNKHQGGIPWNR